MYIFMKRKLLTIGLTFLMMFCIEVALFIILYQSFYVKEYVLEIAFYMLLLSPAFIPKSNKVTVGYCFFIFFIFLLNFMMHVTLHYISRDVFSLEQLKYVGEAKATFDKDYLNEIAISCAGIFLGAYVALLSLIYYKESQEEENMRYIPKGCIASFLTIMTALFMTFGGFQHVEKVNSASDLFEGKNGIEMVEYSSTYLKKSSIRNYGMLTYIFTEAASIGDSDLVSSDIDEYLTYTESVTPVTDAYYGALKNYNVIEIMVETGAEFLVNEYLTPNLYRLSSQGIHMTENYSKNKTNISEYIGITGSVVPNIAYLDVDTPFSLPNVLFGEGYSSAYFHNNSGRFYNRQTVLKKSGFDKLYFTEDINPKNSWSDFDGNYPLDKDTMLDIMKNLAPADAKKPYYSFLTTLSTHGPYTGDENIAKFKEYGYYDKIQYAKANGLWENICSDDSVVVQEQLEVLQCEMMNLDEGIGILLSYLEASKQLDHTLIVVYGDHEPYYSVGLEKPIKEYIYNTEDEADPENYHTMLFFYNEKLSKLYREKNGLMDNEKIEIATFSSPYVIVPTILELLGISYNPKTYMGTSIFQTKSSFDNAFYSHELGSIFTNEIYSIDVTTDYEYVDSKVTKEEKIEFLEIEKDLLYKVSVFNKIYLSNYYKKSK